MEPIPQNEEIARTLEELAEKLEALGELFFKVRAYRKAAVAIRGLETPLAEYRLAHDLKSIPGVGDAIARKVGLMLDQGPREWLADYMAKREV